MRSVARFSCWVVVKLALLGPEVRLMTRSPPGSVVSIRVASIGVGTAPIIALKVVVLVVSLASGIVCRFSLLVTVCRIGWCVVMAICVFSVVRCIVSVCFIGLKFSISIVVFYRAWSCCLSKTLT